MRINPQTAQPADEKTANSLSRYIVERGLPPGVELPAEDIPREQRATIEACEALWAGDEKSGKRLNELWDEIWDGLELPEIRAALAESDERIPHEQARKELGLE